MVGWMIRSLFVWRFGFDPEDMRRKAIERNDEVRRLEQELRRRSLPLGSMPPRVRGDG